MPTSWRVMMIVVAVCLVASVAIGTVRIATTPQEILGAGFQGWKGNTFPH